MNKRKILTAGTLATFGLALGMETAMAAENWDISVWGSRRAFTEHIEKLSEIVNEKSRGEFTIKVHYGEVLSKSRENLDGISIGAFQMAQTCSFYHPDKTPAISVTSLPGIVDTADLREIGTASERAYKHKDVIKEFAKWNAQVVMPSPMPLYNLVGKGKAPETLADFAGLRIRIGGPMGALIRGLDGESVSFTASETYTAMDTGAANAVAFAPHAHLAYKITELGEWRTDNLNLGTVDCPVVMNKDAYDALSDKNRKIFDEAIAPAMDHYYETYASYTDKFLDATKDLKVIMYSPSQKAEIAKVAGTVWDEWKVKMADKGIDSEGLISATQGK